MTGGSFHAQGLAVDIGPDKLGTDHIHIDARRDSVCTNPDHRHTELKCPCGFLYIGYDPEVGERVYDDHECTAGRVAPDPAPSWHTKMFETLTVVTVMAAVVAVVWVIWG